MPETPEDERTRQQQRRDAHDWATLAVLTLTLIAAACAAFFTYEQASVARDQEHRALRAYVVVRAELAADPGTKAPYIKFTAENMGQTPVYDLFFVTWANTAREDGQPILVENILFFDCRSGYAPSWRRNEGHTFSRDYHLFSGISSQSPIPPSSMDDVFADHGKAVAYGTVCYRDVFRDIHMVRICDEWVSPNSTPEKCKDEGEWEQEY